MATFYEEMAQVATDLIREFGAPITVRRNAGGDIDPVDGSTTADDVESWSPLGILKPYPNQLIDGTTIQQRDRLIVLEPGVVEPRQSDTFEVDGVQYPAQSIEIAKPAGTALAYFVQIRR